MFSLCILCGTSFNCLGFIINSGFDGVSSCTDIIIYTLNIIIYYYYYHYVLSFLFLLLLLLVLTVKKTPTLYENLL